MMEAIQVGETTRAVIQHPRPRQVVALSQYRWQLGGFFGNIWDRATYVPRTVWSNTGTSDYSLGGRLYVTAGTTLGSLVGVAQISDAGSDRDAVDGHLQSTGERVFKGAAGAVQLATIGFGAAPSVVKAAAGSATGAARAELTIAPYGQLSQDASIAGQAHHLNQAAAYGDVIPYRQGLSIKLEGNILTDAGARAHFGTRVVGG